MPAPEVSVVVLNYNGARWIERCLESLRGQTCADRLEVIVADNASADGSDRQAEAMLAQWPNAVFLQHGGNLGYCEGNNRAAKQARGRYLFFLNNDAWLEPDCLEVLVRSVELAGAQAATPLVLDYGSEGFQSLGAGGFDLFGLPTSRRSHPDVREVLMPEGCSYLIERGLFERLGGFERVFFMYAEELDLSWRLWLTGHRAVAVPQARLHHRGAADANPRGGEAIVEFRTSDTKRFYANRNCLLVLLMNARGPLLLLVVLQLGLLGIEALVGWLVVRRLSFVRRAYLDAVTGCWRLRGEIRARRRWMRSARRRGDFWMLRFLRLRLNRWDEVVRVARLGWPQVGER